MDRRPYWQASSGDPHRSRRIERMTVALTRLRQIDDAYVIFEARSRPDRYIQFANRRPRGNLGRGPAARSRVRRPCRH